MKKLFAFTLCLTALLILCTLTASAVVNKDGHYTEEAKKIGSDYIVVGRPITAAADPVAAYERCVAEFCD